MARTRLVSVVGFGTVVLLLFVVSAVPAGPVAGTAAKPKSGLYSGRTNQGESISFRVRKGKVGRIRFGYEANCSFGSATGTVSISKRLKVRNGRFKYRSGGTRLSGRFHSRTRARGKLRNKSSMFDPFAGTNTCDTGTVRWSASR